MKYADLKKHLKAKGASFKEGSKHTKVYLNGKQTTIPRHREVNKFVVDAIFKQLDVK